MYIYCISFINEMSNYFFHYHNGEYDGKTHARHRFLSNFKCKYQVSFIKNIKDSKEFYEFIKNHKEDPICLNNLAFKIKSDAMKNRILIRTEEGRNSFRILKKAASEKRKQRILEENKINRGYLRVSNKYFFENFDKFYTFMQNYTIRNKKPHTINFNGSTVINKLKKFFQTYNFVTVKQLNSSLTFKEDNPWCKNFWLERGWSEEESIQKIRETQRKNSVKSINKMTDDRIPSQLLYWVNKKGLTLEEARKKRSEYQNRSSYVSNSSLKLFFPFYEEYKNSYKCYIHQKIDPNSHELGLWDYDNKKLYCYDFSIKELKLIFEYQGLHVHPKKEKLKENWKNWKHYFTKESADQVQKKYDCKLKVAENNGYRVIQLWEDEKNLDLIIKKEIEKSISLLQTS